jgi:hypothetical protein
MVWIGRILSGLVALFLAFDAIAKIAKVKQVMDASEKLGFTANEIVGIGAVLLVSVIVYVIPRTTILGAILLTGYLGGAIATNILAQSPPFNSAFALSFGVIAWLGVALREKGLFKKILVRR